MMAQITTDDLRQMEGKEGLILQGCGGPIQDWIDGINDLLTEEGILLNGSKFTNVSSFQHDGLTNLLFPFDGVELKTGALAMWRLQTHEQFGGTWLSSSQSPLCSVPAYRRGLHPLPCSSSLPRKRGAGLRGRFLRSGVHAEAQRSGFGGERTSSEMSELCRSRGGAKDMKLARTTGGMTLE